MLSVNRTDRFDDHLLERSDEQYRALSVQVLKRDDCRCQFCGFRSLKYMRIIAKDSNYTSYNADDYVTACSLCFFEHRLQLAGKAKVGKIIYLPEFTQAQLNSLIHAIWRWQETHDCDEEIGNPDDILARIEERMQDSVIILGKQAFNPTALGRALKDMDDEYYKKRDVALAGFRFFPDRNKFEAQIKYWVEHVYPKAGAI